MPELPEVETITRDLRSRILDLGISQVKVLLERIVKNPKAVFVRNLTGNEFTEINRLGKLIYIKLKTGDKYLLIHLKMTGQLVFQKGKKIIGGGHSDNLSVDQLPNKFTRVSFRFSDGSELFFNDMRTFGLIKLVDQKELDKILSKFGPDGINNKLVFSDFYDIIKSRSASIKALLLNQAIIAGIGNIYADEILFRAGVRPQRIAKSLKPEEIKKIFNSIKPIFEKAIKYRGTTFNNYRDADGRKGGFVKMLNVYGRAGEKCRKCGGLVKKIKVAQRGTHYCAKCQK